MEQKRSVTALKFFGLVACSLSAPLFFFALWALIDPAGMKASDDNDPFGTPTSRTVLALICGICVAVFFFGRYFWKRGVKIC